MSFPVCGGSWSQPHSPWGLKGFGEGSGSPVLGGTLLQLGVSSSHGPPPSESPSLLCFSLGGPVEI